MSNWNWMSGWHGVGGTPSTSTFLRGDGCWETPPAGEGSTVVSTHTHPMADIVSLEAALSTKSSVGHTHPQSDVTNLTSDLSTKASLAGGAVPTAQLGSGTANSSVFLRGDQTWAAPTAAASGVIPSTWVVASTHTLTGSTTMQPVSGLSFAVSSAAVYRFEFAVGWQTISTTTGIAFGVNGPASPVLVAYETAISTGLNGSVMRTNRAFGVQTAPSAAVDSANVNSFAYVGGVARTGANAGTLQLQVASEVAGSTVSVRGGSVGFLFGPL
jgi:tail-like repeat protein